MFEELEENMWLGKWFRMVSSWRCGRRQTQGERKIVWVIESQNEALGLLDDTWATLG